MKNFRTLFLLPLILLVMSLSSCAAIAGIFKAGFAVGIFAVIIVVALIIWIISMFRSK